MRYLISSNENWIEYKTLLLANYLMNGNIYSVRGRRITWNHDRQKTISYQRFFCFISILFPLIKKTFPFISTTYFCLHPPHQKTEMNEKKMKSINEFIANRGLSKIKWRYWWESISFYNNKNNNSSISKKGRKNFH